MKKRKVTKTILLIFIILLICLLILTIAMLKILKKDENLNNTTNINTNENVKDEKLTIQDIIKKYDSTYISNENEYIYVILAKDLFNENGSSNEKFITNLINDLSTFYKTINFYVIDDQKEIEVFAKYDENEKKHQIIINGVENFYSKVDGDAYILVDKSEIVKGSNLATKNYILDTLELNDGYFSYIEDIVGEGKDIGNGYKSYLDDSIKIRTVPTGAVRNIIFTDKYKENITLKLNTSLSLKEVKDLYKRNDFGSVEKGYLGYRQSDLYLFVYKDEISAYTYSYKENKVFEALLKEYLEDQDLDKFVRGLSNKWKAYDNLEYDEESKTAKICYSARGVDINIRENKPSGITFYSNYYFTDYTKSLVKKGIVSFKPNVDLIEKIEIERRNND